MVYVFLADGFEEIEGLTPVDILRRGGVEVQTVGVTGAYVTSSHKVTVKADIVPEQMVLGDDLEAVVLPGGMPGTLRLGESEAVRDALNFAREKNIIISAICAAPTVLKKAGILDGAKATVFPKFTEELGDSYTDADCYTDGNTVTGRGMGVSVPFALEVLRMLRGSETADRIRNAICYPYN